MFARMATFEGVEASGVEQTLEKARQCVIPILDGLPGWRGATQLYDDRNGKVMVINFFDSEENMEAAEPTFEEMPSRLGPELAERVAGRRRSVEKFRVLAERRVESGAGAR